VDEEKSPSNRKAVILVVLALAVFIATLLARQPTQPPEVAEYNYSASVAGVSVNSTSPFDEIGAWDDLALWETEDPTEVACSLQFISITRPPQYMQYLIEYSDEFDGVRINPPKALVGGTTPAGKLASCHALSCVIAGVECPDDLFMAQAVMLNPVNYNIILPANASAPAGRAYSELVGAVSFLQAKAADLDGDGKLSDGEIIASKVVIRPYFKAGDSCTLMGLNNLIQKLPASNQSISCSSLTGFFIEESNVNEIILDGPKVTLRGDEDTIQKEAIILGNIIAPEWSTKLRSGGQLF